MNLTRKAAGLLAATTLAITGLALTAPASQASPAASHTTTTAPVHRSAPKLPGVWRDGALYNLETAECLDSSYNILSVSPCNGDGFQTWHDLQSTSSSTYQPSDLYGTCTDGGQSNGEFPCNAGNWQQWTFQYAGNVGGRNYYYFHWARNYNTCLDGGQAGVAMWFPCNGNNYQKWSWN
ncbi:hypothetical protein ABH935_008576 [Catenulispora sp. GAS73]|uniref:hypothetical protein n=1 Tax=Catenulispora sp. GAS73 TaxID=3156269 RepID=UPI0035146434